MGGMGELLLALVFFASGATLIKNAQAPGPGASTGQSAASAQSAQSAPGARARGFAAMASKPKFALGIFMLVLGVLVSMYWLVMKL